MTRFARAKGSKSSNERTPEDSTPWDVMKDQLLKAKKENDESKQRQKAEEQRIENYEKFLKERKVQKRKATWCDFPDVGDKTIDTNSYHKNGSFAKKNKKKKHEDNNRTENVMLQNADENEQINVINNSEGSVAHDRKKKKKKKNKTPIEPTEQIKEVGTSSVNSSEPELHKNKNKKKKQKKLLHKPENTPNVNLSEIDTKIAPNAPTNDGETSDNALKQNGKGKKKKMINGQPVRRKEINDHSFQLIINSKEVELVRFDGFPIMKKDAERLQDLKTSMIKKGIPKSEVQRTIKLERRRAEKALARLKREVCYNCRKGGHVLSDCPELKSKIPSLDASEGVCFKCGSTEHRQFECKVQKDGEFRFATCFICKEAGHIARQCPDNPKGLYPNGGSCKLCGDVTHLRKDCPTVTEKKEGSNIKLQTLDGTENIEDVEHQPKPATQEVNKKPKKIKF